MATYDPDPETAALFTRFKRTHQTHRDLLKAVKKVAPAEMRKGATVGQLHAMTGLAEEVFRRIARDEGIERLREPTVGKDAKPKTAD